MIETVNWICGRGKNRDSYGNPYYAAVVFTNKRKIVVPMSYTNDSSEEGVLKNVLHILLDRKVGINQSRVMYHYKKVDRDSALEHPERWIIPGGGRGMAVVRACDMKTYPNIRWPANLKPYNIKRMEL